MTGSLKKSEKVGGERSTTVVPRLFSKKTVRGSSVLVVNGFFILLVFHENVF